MMHSYRSPTMQWLLIGLMLGLSAGIRWPLLDMPLQFDEIWSWEMAHAAGTPGRLFTDPAFHHDNNHLLNTWYLQWWDGFAEPRHYRWLAYGAGCLLVVLTMLWARGFGTWVMLCTGLLLACNSWWVIFSTQARGYTLAACAAMACWLLWRRYREHPTWAWGSALGGMVVVGFLAHFHFLQVYLALAAAMVMHWARERRSLGEEWLHLIRCHWLPVLGLTLLYFFFIRDMELGGGPRPSAGEVLVHLFGQGFGFYQTSPYQWLAGLVGMGLLFGLLLLSLLDRDRTVARMFWLTCLLVPAILFMSMRPPFLFERYFLFPYLFVLILYGIGLGRCAQFPWGWPVVLVLLGLYAWNNLQLLDEYRQEGRVRFAEVVAYLQQAQPGTEPITVAGDVDFRLEKFFAFEGARLDRQRRLRYVQNKDIPKEGVHWLLMHRVPEEGIELPGKVQTDRWGNRYQWVHDIHPQQPMEWRWILLQRIPPNQRPS